MDTEAGAPAPSPALRIALLGHGGVLYAGSPWKLNLARRTFPLLAFLLLRRTEPVSRDLIAFTLWPDDDEEEARANLRRYLYQLQKALPPSIGEPRLLLCADTAQWNPAASLWLDVAEFERSCEGDADLEGAVELYAGDLLESRYDEWLIPERERLHHACLSTLGALIVAYRRRADHRRAILYSRRLLALDPWREDSIRELMALHYESGNAAGALAEYQRFAEVLRTELDVEPMLETTVLRDLIARNRPIENSSTVEREASALAPPTIGLPFAGRQHELEQLHERWSGAARGFGGLVLIGGEAGIGKSRLVAEAARDVERGGGRVLWGSTTAPERTPCQCLIEALRSALPLAAAADIQPEWLAILAQVLPDIRQRGFDLPALPPADPKREQLRLFEALTVCFASIARPRPLLVVLEDLHWAGAATMDAIGFIARRAAQTRMLILATYREEETRRVHPVRVFRREFGRSPTSACTP